MTIHMLPGIRADPHTRSYFDTLVKGVNEQFELAQKARHTGFDVHHEVECIPVTDLADRTEKLAGPIGVAERFRNVLEENKGDRMNALFQLFKEIILEEGGWYANPDIEKRIEQGVKTCLVIMTEGVVVAPLDGLPYVKLGTNEDGTKYVDIYFAGPIRAAGASAAVLPLILGDYAQHLLQLGRYNPTHDEIERYAEEVNIYQTDVVSRQIKMTLDELRIIAKGCPVCINGIPTEDLEVTVWRNLPRVPSNRIRGGMGLVVTEGLGLKALKVMSWTKKLGLDWSFLEKIIKVEKKADQVIELKPNWKYLEGVAAGRPLIAYPSEWGGFRLRYGRSRNTGCAGKGINPALMYLLDEFIAVGTHVRIERPGKAAQLFPVETIDGPTIRLKDGTVKQINTIEEAQLARPLLEKILFVGDLLVTVGDYRKAAHPLTPSPFVPEWWVQLAAKAIEEGKKTNIDITTLLENPYSTISFTTALQLSEDLHIPLHPHYTWFYKGWNIEETKKVIDAIKETNDALLGLGLLHFPREKGYAKLFEKAGIPHRKDENRIHLDEETTAALRLFTRNNVEPIHEEDTALSLLSRAAGIEIKDRAGTFAGGRMGRPEAASPRTMKGNPHVLFPISLAGGNTRSMNKAAGLSIVKGKTRRETNGKINVEIGLFECPSCQNLNARRFCIHCQKVAQPIYTCTNSSCATISKQPKCTRCGLPAKQGIETTIDLRQEMEMAAKNLIERIPDPVKGVKGLISDEKKPEPIEKGILRAKHDLHVFRDGTGRFELLNAPITHFYPKEIGMSVEKAIELGYTHDVKGNPLEQDNQMLEMFVQDIIVNEGCGDWLLRSSHFVDDLLTKFYKLDSYYNAKNRNDMIGKLVIGLAPHTSAGIVGRVIGYSKTRLGWGHPYFVMCKRRNIDGDQDSVMLLMDALLNFSHTFLSKSRGGRMDAPLVFTVALNPQEIDDEVHEMETCSTYPISFYEKTLTFSEPKIDEVPVVKKKLGKENQYIQLNYSHTTSQFDRGPTQSTYTKLQSMEEKLHAQARLQSKLVPLQFQDSLERVIVSHLFPDIIGNTRAFSRQTFRCTKCNAKYRRIPLKGSCIKCDGGNVILTIAQGSVRKYLAIAKEMIYSYNLSDYLKQRIQLAETEINAVFPPEKQTQKSLFEFA
ncbi:MAG: DNA polymerase II large subunit [Candidatus Diapherotrites archaeon]